VFGVGAGNFSFASVPYGLIDEGSLPYEHAHNVPLTIATELGIPGLLAFFWLAWAVTRLALRAVRRRGDPELGPLGLSVAAAIAAVTVTSLGDYPPRTNAIAATFIVLVGVLVALDRLAARDYADASSR
jgi:O-antigen ligase